MTTTGIAPETMTDHGFASDTEIRGPGAPPCGNCTKRQDGPPGVRTVVTATGKETYWVCGRCGSVIAIRTKEIA